MTDANFLMIICISEVFLPYKTIVFTIDFQLYSKKWETLVCDGL